MDALLEQIVAAHDGALTAQALRERRIPRSAVRTAMRSGELVRIGRGTYVAAPPGSAWEDAHRRRAHAVLADAPTDALLTHHSALVHWHLPTHGADLDVVHLGRIAKPSVTAARGRVWHRLPRGVALPTGEASTSPAVCPAVAIVQVGLSSPRAALVAADRALRNTDPSLRDVRGAGAATRDDLARAVEAYRRCTGIAGARWAVAVADPASESPGESLLRHDLLILGLDVETQFVVPLPDGRHARCDMRIRGSRVVVEYDGEGKYEATDPRTRAAVRVAERHREAALRRQGWRIARFTRHDLGRFAVISRRLDEAT